MPPVGFEPTISAGERTQTYALYHAATGIDTEYYVLYTISFRKSCLSYFVIILLYSLFGVCYTKQT
jgi:hypothetical protein